jgi:hypothetical protein
MTLQPPAVPDFRPEIPVGTLQDVLNAKVRDPFTFLETKVVFRANRANSWNVNAGLPHRFVPWDDVDEDPYGGWTNPADLGGGASTTLSAGTAVNAATFAVTSATGLAIGDYVRIGPAGASREYRQIKSIAGTTITPGIPGGGTENLGLAHSAGDAVVEVVSDPSVYVCPASGWYIGEGAINLASSVVTVAGQVLIPGICVDELSPIGIPTAGPAWEGGELFQATAAVQHTVTGLWEFYANQGQRIRLDYWLSSETTGNQPVDIPGRVRLSLVWSGV